MQRLVVSEAHAGERIDRYIASACGLSRGAVQNLLKAGQITLNDRATVGSKMLKSGDKVSIDQLETNTSVTVLAPKLHELYRDDDVIVIDKPAGISVHPGSGKRVATIADALRPLTSDDDADRPGIVHRLDRDTSGVMIAARTPAAKLWLTKEFKERRVEKTYTALVIGRLRPIEATISLPLARSPKDPLRRAPSPNGKAAETTYRVIMEQAGYSLIECRPLTGRTHQIRAHLTAIGHPIAGDVRYGAPAKSPFGLGRQFLHAKSLKLMLPSGETRTFDAPLPPELKTVLDRLEAGV